MTGMTAFLLVLTWLLFLWHRTPRAGMVAEFFADYVKMPSTWTGRLISVRYEEISGLTRYSPSMLAIHFQKQGKKDAIGLNPKMIDCCCPVLV
jgi:hypothetical protein